MLIIARNNFIQVSPEDTVDEMAGKDVKHDKDKFPNAGTPNVGNHHVSQQGGVPGLIICMCSSVLLCNSFIVFWLHVKP